MIWNSRSAFYYLSISESLSTHPIPEAESWFVAEEGDEDSMPPLSTQKKKTSWRRRREKCKKESYVNIMQFATE